MVGRDMRRYDKSIDQDMLTALLIRVPCVCLCAQQTD